MQARPISDQHIEYSAEEKRVHLGMMSGHRWHMDPKVLLFSMARYKFVAKMLTGTASVLEVGCGDGWGTHLVAHEVQSIHAVDIDPVMVAECRKTQTDDRITFAVHDMQAAPLEKHFDAVYLLDVLEHVQAQAEDQFLRHVTRSLGPDGVCIVGLPSLESQAYASAPSRATHVNCKSGKDFKKLLQRYFKNVFLFSMNDEVVHTGFTPMAHYLLCLCVGVRQEIQHG
ncbi:MAG: class I SAM-dependent methyltransferase [Desulfobacteraceae bacterium]|nr:class I SAM-dependent methyltransferase [Desulfobacteraceae bacterium]